MFIFPSILVIMINNIQTIITLSNFFLLDKMCNYVFFLVHKTRNPTKESGALSLSRLALAIA